MNFKRYFCNFNHFITRTFVIVVSVFTLLSFSVYSNEDSYQLTKIAPLEHQLISQPNWQQFIANPSNKQQHFIIRESGQVYLIDDEINPEAVLDMSVFKQTGSSLFKLTAIELHPNFSLRNQVGYGTFYTAHIETINKNSKTKRIQERGDDLALNFDAVITEWQFSAVNHQKVDVNTKREVFRIGVPDNLMVIKQMSFNPYVKSWNDDFGLLYVALSGASEWPQPLYSGVILRINPAKYGLRSFTVPKSNPYLKNSQINDAIYLLGGQQIEQFIWPEKISDHILVSHQYNNKYLLSLTDGLDDWRDSAVKHILYQSDDAIHYVLMYQGHKLPLLRSKLLLLRQTEQHWFIDSLAFNLSDNKKIRDETKPQLEWSMTSQQLPTNSQIILSNTHDGEIFLLEKNLNILFRLTQQALVNEKVVEDSDNNAIEKNTSNNNFFILLLILMSLGTIYYWFKRNRHSVKAIVKQQFASIKLSESCQQIGLYHRHQRSTKTIINIVDIVRSEVKLNEHSISVINAQLGYGFNNDKEQSLRAIFVKEKTDKMVDDKVRQITLLLTDNQKNSYTVCLYMRKGDNRITKKYYVQVIDELIDWCWLIGSKLNADETDKRKVQSIVLPNKKTEIKPNKQNEIALDNQATTSRPVTHKIDHVSQTRADEESSNAHQNHTVNTELLNALDKLVNLQKQGFLTMDEFSKAKENLLKVDLKSNV